VVFKGRLKFWVCVCVYLRGKCTKHGKEKESKVRSGGEGGPTRGELSRPWVVAAGEPSGGGEGGRGGEDVRRRSSPRPAGGRAPAGAPRAYPQRAGWG
jgi:hypothetical protein